MIPATAAFAREFCERNGIERTAGLRLRLIIEELFTNSITHGYRGESDARIRLALAMQDGALTLRYEDEAPEYDPRAQWSRAVSSLDRPAGERPVGGLGVHLVDGLAIETRYTRDEGLNRLWLTVRR